MKKEFIIGTIAVIVLVVAGIWLAANMSTKSNSSSSDVSAYVAGDANNIKATLTYTDEGFMPMAIAVAPGSSIKIINNSTIDLLLAVGDHAALGSDTELGIPTLAPDKSIVIKVSKIRMVMFHNHLRMDHTGNLTVKQ